MLTKYFKTKKSLILIGLFLFRFHPSFAHQSDRSTMMLYQDEKGRSFLQIYGALTAFEGEIDYLYSEKSYKTPEQFKQLVINHFKKNVYIILNSKDTLRLDQPQVILGHETKVVCEVFGFPKNINELLIKNTLFMDIPNNQSTVIVLQKGLPNEQFTLNNNNKQQIHLKLIDGNWQQVNSKKMYFSYWLVIIVLSLVFLGSFIVYKKRFQKALK
jgi:hypothetical protein